MSVKLAGSRAMQQELARIFTLTDSAEGRQGWVSWSTDEVKALKGKKKAQRGNDDGRRRQMSSSYPLWAVLFRGKWRCRFAVLWITGYQRALSCSADIRWEENMHHTCTPCSATQVKLQRMNAPSFLRTGARCCTEPCFLEIFFF